MDIKKFLDQEGLAYLWKKLSLQDYPNNDTLVAIINAIDENKANKTDIKQSDWEQTDEEAIDFIKNKPDENDALSLLTELDFVTAATNEDGAIFIDEGNSIYGLTEENQGYAFKRLSEVDTIEEASDNLNILVENNGEIVKIAASSIKTEDALTR